VLDERPHHRLRGAPGEGTGEKSPGDTVPAAGIRCSTGIAYAAGRARMPGIVRKMVDEAMR